MVGYNIHCNQTTTIYQINLFVKKMIIITILLFLCVAATTHGQITSPTYSISSIEGVTNAFFGNRMSSDPSSYIAMSDKDSVGYILRTFTASGATLVEKGSIDVGPQIFSIDVHGDTVFYLDGNNEVYTTTTPDSGVTWGTPELVVNETSFTMCAPDDATIMIPGSGIVDVYTRSGSVWSLATTLTPVITPTSLWGGVVRCVGDYLFARDNFYQSDTGVVSVFKRTGGTWAWDSDMQEPTPVAGNQYGVLGCTYGTDTIVVANVHRVTHYVYKLAGGVWSVDTILTTPSPMNCVAFGSTANTIFMADTSNKLLEQWEYTTSWAKTTTFSPEDGTSYPAVDGTVYHNDLIVSASNGPSNQGVVHVNNLAPTTSPTVAPTSLPAAITISLSTVQAIFTNTSVIEGLVSDFFSQLDVSFPEHPAYETSRVVEYTETGTLTVELVNAINNNTRLEEAFKQVVCGSQPDECTVNIVYARRALSDMTNTQIEVSFSVSPELYAAMGTTTLADSAFEQALADALSITNNDNIIITSSGGIVKVYATLLTDVAADPLDTTLVDASYDLQDSMDSIIASLISSLGGGGTVVSTNIDLCPPARTCSGQGTCNPNTGVCACVGDWWGIDCETPCTCSNNGICINVMCHCEFPWYGLRCDIEKDCSC